MVAHEEQRSVWPISKVYEVLKRILEDDLVTQYERVDLFNVLSSIADAPDSEKTVDDIYDEDPDIIFPDNEFLVYWKAKIWNKEES